jgi:hypothetical protein
MPTINGFDYDWIGPFSEGLAPARKDGQEFHIRRDGTPAYDERFDQVGSFSEGLGLALVRKGRQRFHIRRDGFRVD